MILYRVLAILPDKVKVIRLTVRRWPHKPPVVTPRKSTVNSLTKYVIVSIGTEVQGLFERAVAGNLTDSDTEKVSEWLHGQKAIWR